MFEGPLTNNGVTMAEGTPQSLEAQVWDYLNQGNVRQAIATCEQLNKQFPDF